MTGKKRAAVPPRPWHEQTPLVVGASLAALVVIGLLYLAVSCVARNYNEPPSAPAQYVGPSTSGSTAVTTFATTATTTETITSTVPPQTSELDGPSSSTDTSPTSTTSTSVSITQSRHSHADDPRWPYPLRPSQHITVMPQH